MSAAKFGIADFVSIYARFNITHTYSRNRSTDIARYVPAKEAYVHLIKFSYSRFLTVKIHAILSE